MRRATPENQLDCSASYGAGTRVEVHRSRYELERVLRRFGAGDVLFVEADANASIQFELQGRYVQLALPLPDPQHARFTHTPSGKPRAAAAQERAYEQALREHWRSLLVAVRGKLQSVESGISTFEQEFDRFFVPHFAAEKTKRTRKTPKAVNWLLGGSHSLAIAMVAAFLVPASAVGAFALPTNVVGHLAAPFRSAVRDDINAARGGNGVALARGGWVSSNGGSPPGDAARLFALGGSNLGSTDGQLRETANLSSPPVEPFDPPAPVLASARTSPLQSGGDASPPPSSNGAGSTGDSQPQVPNPGEGDDAPPPPPPADEDTSAPPADSGDAQQDDSSAAEDPSAGDAPFADLPGDAPADEPGAGGAPRDDAPPPDAGDNPPSETAPPGNGNGNGSGNGNGGTPPGQEKKDDPNNTPPGQSNDPPGNGKKGNVKGGK